MGWVTVPVLLISTLFSDHQILHREFSSNTGEISKFEKLKDEPGMYVVERFCDVLNFVVHFELVNWEME